jgi:dynein heavy chain 1
MTGSTRSFGGLGNDAPFDIDMEEEVRLSYESVKNVDVLDVTSGTCIRCSQVVMLT